MAIKKRILVYRKKKPKVNSDSNKMKLIDAKNFDKESDNIYNKKCE
jgi:hypothetical protein